MSSSERRVAAWALPELHAVTAMVAEPEPAGPSEAELAWLAGRDAGRDEAVAAVEERLAGALEALAGAVASLHAERAAYVESLEANLYALAVAVAGQVVQREVATDPGIVRELVRKAIDVLPLDSRIEVRLNRDDLAALEGHLDLFAPGGRRLEVQWTPDPAIERGGFAIETPQRVVDGRVDQALLALYERLRDV